MALTSTITNKLTDPDGNPIPYALVTISLVAWGITPFRLDDFSEVTPVTQVLTDITGTWTIALERTANISIANTYYIAQEIVPSTNPTNLPISGIRTTLFQVGPINQSLQAAAVAQPLGGPVSYLTQAAGDARYVQAPGSFGAAPPSVTPRTQVGSAGVLNTYSRGDHQHPFLNAVRARAHKEANTVLVANVATPVTYHVPNDYDPLGIFNPGTGIFTCPVAGTYLVMGCISYGGITAGGSVLADVYKNGSPYARGGQDTAVTGGLYGVPVLALVPCAINDQLTVDAFQTTGANCNILGSIANSQQTWVGFQLQGD